MNAKIQNLLSDIAKCVRLSLEFPDGAPIRISGYQDADAPFFLISVDQPDSELIFAILQKIGRVPVQVQIENFWSRNLPWFINRPYENEAAGEVAFKARRLLRQQLNREWRAGLWALCAYVQLGCPNEFRDFLQRHPEKLKYIPLVCYVTIKNRIGNFFSKLVRPQS
jgi:hypothetical protein